MPTFNTIAILQERLAGVLKASSWADLVADAPYWDRILANAHQTAYQDIVAAFARRGYALAQIETWDRGDEVEEDLAIYHALVMGGALHNYDDKFIKQFDSREELRTVSLTIAGEIPEPEADVLPIQTGEVKGGNVTFFRRVEEDGTVTETKW